MPGAKLDGASIYELLETQRVSFTAAGPDCVDDVCCSIWEDSKAKLSRPERESSSAGPLARVKCCEYFRTIMAWLCATPGA